MVVDEPRWHLVLGEDPENASDSAIPSLAPVLPVCIRDHLSVSRDYRYCERLTGYDHLSHLLRSESPDYLT